MRSNVLVVETITFAIKGRDLLRKSGYKAHIERRTNSTGGVGCGYVIIAEGNTQQIVNTLKNSGIKIIEIISK